MFAEASEDREHSFARSTHAEGAPEIQRIVITQPAQVELLTAGQRVARKPILQVRRIQSGTDQTRAAGQADSLRRNAPSWGSAVLRFRASARPASSSDRRAASMRA